MSRTIIMTNKDFFFMDYQDEGDEAMKWYSIIGGSFSGWKIEGYKRFFWRYKEGTN